MSWCEAKLRGTISRNNPVRCYTNKPTLMIVE